MTSSLKQIVHQSIILFGFLIEPLFLSMFSFSLINYKLLEENILDMITEEILTKSLELKKIIYAREQFTHDEKMLHALTKTRASLIKLEKTIQNKACLKALSSLDSEMHVFHSEPFNSTV